MRAVVLLNGELKVRQTPDPVPGPGELLIKTLSTAICASDVHYMDHPGASARFVYDNERDTVMGHEFVGEVVGHGPECSDEFPLGTRVTSMPILVRGEERLVIGHHPDAPGGYGELMLVSQTLAKAVPDGVPNDAVAVVDAFAVGEFYVRSSHMAPGDIPIVIGAGAIGLSAVAALASRNIQPIIVADYSAERLEFARKFGAHVTVDPREQSPHDVWRDLAAENKVTTPAAIFECVGAPGLIQSTVESCVPGAHIFSAGAWHTNDTVSCTDAIQKGVTIQFGGGPHPQDWYGTLDAVAEGRLDPLPSIGATVDLDGVADAVDQVRKAQGPPRIVIHPGG